MIGHLFGLANLKSMSKSKPAESPVGFLRIKTSDGNMIASCRAPKSQFSSRCLEINMINRRCHYLITSSKFDEQPSGTTSNEER